MADSVKVHQALHGYGDGHQLLASSMDFTREQQWQLLVMSDLSGPAFRSGFESYVSGYPLVSGGYYCFAKTWFAPEQARPGCVWTHTLLVPDTEVARVLDFSSLASRWRKPQSSGDSDSFSTELTIASGDVTPSNLSRTLACAAVYGLYGQPDRPLAVASELSKPFEPLVIALLSQQWARLRRSFRFCTGALARPDVPYDFVIGPPNVFRNVQADSRATGSFESNDVPAEEHEWVDIATDDLLAGAPGSGLRRYLSLFGPDYTDGRAAYRPLCQIYSTGLQSQAQPEQLISLIARFAPEPDASRRLKAAYFGRSETAWSSTRDATSVARALVVHPAVDSIPSDVAVIAARAAALVESNFLGAADLAAMAGKIGGSRGEEFLRGFAEGVASRPGLVSDLPLSVVLDLLKRSEALIGAPVIWSRPPVEQLEIAGYVVSLGLRAADGDTALMAALGARAWSAIGILIAHFPSNGVRTVLNWIEKSRPSGIALPAGVRRALEEHRHQIVEAVASHSVGPYALRTLTALLDPRSFEVRKLGAAVWLAVVSMEEAVSPDAESGAQKSKWGSTGADGDNWEAPYSELVTDAFVLALGFLLRSGESAALVRAAFTRIYEAARVDGLPVYLWDYVEPELPWSRSNWDRCERLIKGAVRLFVDRRWPPEEFLATFGTREQLERAVSCAADSTSGRSYMRMICRECDYERDATPGYRRDVITAYCDR